MRYLILTAALFGLAACASTPTPYGPAASERGKGFTEQRIESDRYRVFYKGDDIEQARNYALLRAAELTLEQGQDWFQVVQSYGEVEPSNAGRSSVSVGGSTGSYGSGVGIGIGIGLGSFGGGSGTATEALEIVLGSGEAPDDPNAYDARSVQASLLGAPL